MFFKNQDIVLKLKLKSFLKIDYGVNWMGHIGGDCFESSRK